MNENVKTEQTATPMLFPFEPSRFWQSLRQIIREEVTRIEKSSPTTPTYNIPGLTYKPLYRIGEVCTIF
ncbi:DNA-binding protein [Chitinophaga barathri]|uniref:DNA-binding protein n=1 Tax=Chitinophaga barathri TaxID=1647451 RepID=UPI001F4DC17E|nr:DNA-binding protein [Chitinophaga barathri]